MTAGFLRVGFIANCIDCEHSYQEQPSEHICSFAGIERRLERLGWSATGSKEKKVWHCGCVARRERQRLANQRRVKPPPHPDDQF